VSANGSVSPSAACPTCGSSAVADAPGGRCPRCLLGVAITADEMIPSAQFDSNRRQFGEYVLGHAIGAGGMGVVYEARRLIDDRKVAIKLIRDVHAASPAQLCRFTLEAEATARLDHPHIVRIHEVGECNGQPFFSMDLVAGESLNTRIARGGLTFGEEAKDKHDPADQREIARLMAKIARAVHHAHLRGVLHRDLKPANIIIDAEGNPHLTDFGLAKMLAASDQPPRELTSSGDLPGTPSYMSPEQVSGRPLGCASDIYGLGAVLYALLTGRPPFQGATPLETFKQIVDQPPVRPRSVNPLVQPHLETICLKCLEKDPGDRYGTAEAVAEDLESFVAGRAVKARRAGVVHRTRVWVRANPLGAALIASLCLGLAVTLGLLKVVNDQRREIELDRDQVFDEGMQKVSQIWRDPATKGVTISARELAILAGRSPASLRGAKHHLTLGISADDGPSSMAQRYGAYLAGLQDAIERKGGEKVAFNLRLLKRFNRNDETLARSEVDLMVLSAVEFLKAQRQNSNVALLAQYDSLRHAVIFASTNSGIQQLSDLRGKSLVLPDPDLSLTAWAKARLFAAGITAKDLRSCAGIVDQGPETGQTVISTSATIDHVLRGAADAGVAYRGHFERYRYLGLVAIDRFEDMLAARAEIDPSVMAALRLAVRSPEGSNSPARTGSITEAAADDGAVALPLCPLHQAMRDAERFDLER
jgi:ABC-type phosphate/phosphonate transport system substrate-binding protein